MARRGFLQRAGDAIRKAGQTIANLFRAEELTPPPEPPRRRPAPTTPPDRYQQAYMEETLRRPGTAHYNAMLRFAHDMPEWQVGDDSERLEFWREFLRFSQPGGQRRNDPNHPFWRYSGRDPRDFDWHGWREAMNYPHGKRAR